jgi:23S rRNA (uracil1939-C5)-methyltransferase
MPVLEELCVKFGSRKGELSLSVTLSLSGLDVAVKGGKPLDGQLRIDLAVFAGTAGLARLAWDGETIAAGSAPAQAFGVAHVVPPSGAFLQATEHGQTTLVDAVLEIVSGSKRVVDLFAGCGTFSLPIASSAEVHAVEGVSDMMIALDMGWRRAQGLKRVTTETRDLFRRPLLEDEFKGFDAVVIDPPRAGAEAQMRILAESGVAVIAAVSCNPVTFARDAKILTDAGYVMGPITVVDQFRWSPHTEVVAGFSRAKK